MISRRLLGRPIAAYLYLPRRPGQRSYQTREVEPGLVIDLSRWGRPTGTEITAPTNRCVGAVECWFSAMSERHSIASATC